MPSDGEEEEEVTKKQRIEAIREWSDDDLEEDNGINFISNEEEDEGPKEQKKEEEGPSDRAYSQKQTSTLGKEDQRQTQMERAKRSSEERSSSHEKTWRN